MTSWRPTAWSSQADARKRTLMSSLTPRWSATQRSSSFDNCLSCEWEGDKGETYTIATSGSGKSWVCTRKGFDGASKQFTLELDKAAGTIWWGIAGAYYCDVFNEVSEGQLSWYKPNARKPSFVWWAKSGTKKQEDSTPSWSQSLKPSASGATKQEDSTPSWSQSLKPSASGGVHEWKPTARHQTAVPKARTSSVAPTPVAQKRQTKRWTEENGDKQMDDIAVQEEQPKVQPLVNDKTEATREAGSAVRQLLQALKIEFEKKSQSRAREARFKEQPTILKEAWEAPVAVALDAQSQHSLAGCSHDFTLPPGLEVPPGLERPRQAAASSVWPELSPPPGLPVWPTSPQGTHLSKSDDETRMGSDQSSQADDLDYSVDPVDSEQPVLPLLSASPQQLEAHEAQKQAVQAPAPEQLQLHFAKLHLWTQPHQLEQPQQPAKIRLGSAQQPAKPQLQPAGALQETLADTHEFFITLDKTDGTQFGVTLDRADGRTLHIDSISDEGLFKRWNDSNPGLSVKPTDRIVEANGIRGEVADVIAELKEDKVLRLRVLRTKGQAQEALAQEPQVGKTEKLTTSTSAAQVVGKAKKDKGKDTDQIPRKVGGVDKGERQKACQQHQFAVGPVAIPTAVDAAKQAALATHATTWAGRRAVYGGSWPTGLLDGRWNDACGEVGRIRGETMIWAHPVVGMVSTKVEHNGHYVRLNFLGQTLCGVFRGNQIHWSESDVWWRHQSGF